MVRHILVLAAVVSLPIGIRRSVEALHHRDALVQLDTEQSRELNASFTWRTWPRYGLDINNNGIVDLPNSAEYVNNRIEWYATGCPCLDEDCTNPQFRVRLDASATSFPANPFTLDLRDADVASDTRDRSYVDLLIEAARARARRRQLVWTIAGGPDIAIVDTAIYEPDHTTNFCAPEGEYRVSLKAVDNNTEQWDEFTRVISVEDILVVQLGDSYASGEGNPERRIPADVALQPPFEGEATLLWAQTQLHLRRAPGLVYVLWADDGEVYDWHEARVSTYAVGGDYHNPWGYDVPVTLTARVPPFDQFSQMHRDHYRSHRSSLAAGSQFALHVENASDNSSVTFVNLAMSGATTNQGMLGSHKGVSGERFFDGSSPMTSQLNQLHDIVGDRSIDVLLLSIGGNDAGFANAAEALVLRDGSYLYTVEQSDILHGVRTGNWTNVENSAGLFGLATQWDDLLGLNAIPAQYTEIARQFPRLDIDVSRVYVTEYPNFGQKYYPEQIIQYSPTTADTIPAHVAHCEQVLNSVRPNDAPGGLEISRDELEWATWNILSPLNATIETVTSDNDGWVFVDGIRDVFRYHGYCAWAPYDAARYNPVHPVPDRDDELTMRWFRRETESSIIQHVGLINTGVLHPNEYGHRAIAMRLLEVVRLPAVKNFVRTRGIIVERRDGP